MKEVQLKDICDLDNGFAFKSDDYVDESNTLNCRMSNIRPDGSFDILYSAKYLPDEFVHKYKDYILRDGDLIIAMTDMAGDPKILGVPTVVNTRGYNLLLNQRVGKLRLIKNGVNIDYLKLALQCPNVRHYLKRFAGGGVQLNVSKKDILNAPVRMRSEDEQKYIAALFMQVLEVKTRREQELQLLDKLIQARFIEMFDEKYPEDTLLNLCNIIDYRGKTPEKVECGLPFITAKNVKMHYMTLEPQEYISKETYDKVMVRGFPKEGDVLFTTEAPLGNVCRIPHFDTEFYIGQRIVTMQTDELNTIYLEYALSDDEFVRKYIGKSSGSTVTGIRVKLLEQLSIPVAPRTLQDKFAAFVEQVNKLKVEVRKSLDETQMLFDSLMQKYFG